jgi:hypothetical protein
MPPFRSFAPALRLLTLLGRRAGHGSAPRTIGREIELYRGPPGPVGQRADPGRGGTADVAARPSGSGQRRAGGTGRGVLGLGAGGLVVTTVLSFGVVLGGATVLAVVRGGPMTRSSPAHQRAGPAPEVSAGPGPDGTVSGGPGPAGTAQGGGSAPGGGSGGSGATAAAARAALPGRIQEILQVREEAFALRDAGLLATVYTADCACLRSGREAIAQLRADHAVWRGRSVSVRVERLSRVNGSLWVALALLRRSAFRIETEHGDLISAEPAVRQRYRFALARSPSGTWLLGHASLVEELPT